MPIRRVPWVCHTCSAVWSACLRRASFPPPFSEEPVSSVEVMASCVGRCVEDVVCHTPPGWGSPTFCLSNLPARCPAHGQPAPTHLSAPPARTADHVAAPQHPTDGPWHVLGVMVRARHKQQRSDATRRAAVGAGRTWSIQVACQGVPLLARAERNSTPHELHPSHHQHCEMGFHPWWDELRKIPRPQTPLHVSYARTNSSSLGFG